MNHVSQIIANPTTPSLQSIAHAVVTQIREVGKAHGLTELQQAALMATAADELTRVQIAADFIAGSDRVNRNNDCLAAYIGGDDERTVTICWEVHNASCNDPIAYLRGVVIDEAGEYGAPLIIPASCCAGYFGAEMVRNWDKHENETIGEDQ